MFRHLIRWGAAALLVFSFAQPARALPLGGAEDGFTVSVGDIWEQLVEAFVETWEGVLGSCPNGICPGGGDGDSPDGRGTCDPNGGGCAG